MSCSQTSSDAMRRTSTISPFRSGETGFAGNTLRLKREADFALQIVIPAQRLLLRAGIEDGLGFDAIFADRISLRFLHRIVLRTRRTEVRPIWSCRAISEFAEAAAAESSDFGGVRGCCCRPAQTFPVLPGVGQPRAGSITQDFALELGEDRQQSGHRSAGWSGQIQRLGERDEPSVRPGDR
jgi:hypothetical protein